LCVTETVRVDIADLRGCSESAAFAHFIVCIAAAAAIASIIRPSQSNSLQSLSDRGLVVSGAFEAGASKPTMRDSSPLPGFTRARALPNVARAPRRPMEVQSRLTKFRRVPVGFLIERRTGRLMR